MGLINHYVITFTSASIILLLATLMWSVRISSEDSVAGNMRTARRYLSASYYTIAIVGPLLVFFYKTFSDNIKMFATATAIESTQVMLLTATVIALIAPKAIDRIWMTKHSLAILVINAVLATAVFLVKQRYTIAICHTAAIIYALYIAVCAVQFGKVFRNRMMQTATQQEYDPKRIRKTYSYIIIMAFLSFTTDIAILNMADIDMARTTLTTFIIVYTIFYAYLLSRFYNYLCTAYKIMGNTVCTTDMPQADMMLLPAYSAENVPAQDAAQQHNIPEKDLQFGKTLAKWVEEKKYLNKDITIEDVTEQLETSKKYIYYYFRTYMNTNFRTWRTELRIKEAQQILTENPDMSLEKVAEMTGFNHRANFFQQFQKITGMSPTEYKKQ